MADVWGVVIGAHGSILQGDEQDFPGPADNCEPAVRAEGRGILCTIRPEEAVPYFKFTKKFTFRINFAKGEVSCGIPVGLDGPE